MTDTVLTEDLQDSFDSMDDEYVADETVTAEETKDDQANADEAQEPEPSQTVEADPYAPLRSEFAQLLEQREQKLYGKIGELNRTLQELRSSKTNTTPRQIGIEQLKHFRQEFGDEAAEMLAKDLSDLVAGPDQSTQAVDVNAAIEEFKKENLATLVASQHRDWQKVATDDAFIAFRQGLSPEHQTLLGSTWDPLVVVDAISAFKAFQKLKNTENFELWHSKLQNTDVQARFGKEIDPDFYVSAHDALLAWNKEFKSKSEQKPTKNRRLEAAVNPVVHAKEVDAGMSLDDWFNSVDD